LRFYFLGANWRRRVQHVGAKSVRDLAAPLIA
jgi:CRISPR-associated protein Cas2